MLSRSSLAARQFPHHFAAATTSVHPTVSTVVVIEGVDASAVCEELRSRLPNAYVTRSLPDDMLTECSRFDTLDETERRQFYLLGNIAHFATIRSKAGIVILDRSYATPEHKWPAHLQPRFVFRLTRGESKDTGGIPIDVTNMKPTDTAALILAAIESQCIQ